jgi:hypothetical protein
LGRSTPLELRISSSSSSEQQPLFFECHFYRKVNDNHGVQLLRATACCKAGTRNMHIMWQNSISDAGQTLQIYNFLSGRKSPTKRNRVYAQTAAVTRRKCVFTFGMGRASFLFQARRCCAGMQQRRLS